MSSFDQIIGYSAVKKELKQIADILKNPEAYSKLGVSAPRGLLLFGQPGVGKSLMAQALMEESGRTRFLCRKDQPNGDFVKHIKEIFQQAMEQAPSVILLDDMDKFANVDERHPDAEEYVTIQSCIDEAKDKAVFVVATVNNMRALPRSLSRAGRFDRTIEVEPPHGNDAKAIISHYLKGKRVAEDVDLTTIARIMDGHSCAELETVINEAGLYAGYERCESITMSHLLEACLQIFFDVPYMDDDAHEDTYFSLSDAGSTGAQIVYHEAGHAVISEILCPGSVTLVSAYNRSGNRGGFTEYYNDQTHTPQHWNKSRTVASLGGIAAVEHKYGIFDLGAKKDLEKAFEAIRDLVGFNGICGLHLHSYSYSDTDSGQLRHAQEQAVSVEIERFYRKAKEILARNREFLDKLAAALSHKRLLTFCDIQKIKQECTLVPVTL